MRGDQPAIMVPIARRHPADDQREADAARADAGADDQLMRPGGGDGRGVGGSPPAGATAAEALRGEQLAQRRAGDGVGGDAERGRRGVRRGSVRGGRPQEREPQLEQFQDRLGGDGGELPGVAYGDGTGIVGLNAREAFQLTVQAVAGLDQLPVNHRQARHLTLQVADPGLETIAIGGLVAHGRGCPAAARRVAAAAGRRAASTGTAAAGAMDEDPSVMVLSCRPVQGYC